MERLFALYRNSMKRDKAEMSRLCSEEVAGHMQPLSNANYNHHSDDKIFVLRVQVWLYVIF